MVRKFNVKLLVFMINYCIKGINMVSEKVRLKMNVSCRLQCQGHYYAIMVLTTPDNNLLPVFEPSQFFSFSCAVTIFQFLCPVTIFQFFICGHTVCVLIGSLFMLFVNTFSFSSDVSE